MPVMAVEEDIPDPEVSDFVVLDIQDTETADAIEEEPPMEEETAEEVNSKEITDEALIENIKSESAAEEDEEKISESVTEEIVISVPEVTTEIKEFKKNTSERNSVKKPKTSNKAKAFYASKIENTDENNGEPAETPDENTIQDGIYIPDNFTVSGGTGKVTITCPNVKIEGDQVLAKIVFSSQYYTKVKIAGTEYSGIIDTNDNTATYFVPVEINKDYEITGTTTRMSEPHDIDYTLNITLTKDSQTTTEPGYDEINKIQNGTYLPDDFTVTGGTGKVTITCPMVTITDDGAAAVIVFGSQYYTKVRVGEQEFAGVIDTAANTATYSLPVELNCDYEIIGTTTRMSEPHDIAYVLNIALSKDSEKIEIPEEDPAGPENPDTPDNPSEPVDPADPDNPDNPDNPVNPGPEKPVKPTKPDKIADGTYQIKADTDNRMFYMVPKDNPNAYRATLVKKNGKLKVTFTLSGTGYDYLYMGTATKAAKTDKAKWTKFKESNGYYSYTMEIPALDKELTIASHSEKQDKWYEHTIIFYSDGAKKVKDGTSTVPDKPKKDKDKDKNKDDKNNTSGTQTDFKNDNKKDKESESKGDTEKSTSAVDSSTGLADGVYTPDKFSWSGGSGRLAYIRCDKITVTDGQAYATIVFSSSSYDQLKANGRVYWNGGGEFSTFVIPVQLNANNTIVGRTTAMSAPHWIEYSIFIYSNAAAKATGGKEITGESIKTSKLSEETPEIAGLESKNSTKVKYAKNFKIFNYKDGVKLLQMDITKKSGMKYKKDDKKAEDKVEYDDEGKPIAKSQGEITEELYHANVVNYLIVPEGVEIPAGLDKECVIINAPVKNAQVSSEAALQIMDQLGITKYIKATGIDAKEIKIDNISKRFDKEKTFYAGDYAKPDYKEIIKNKIEINILPAEAVAAKIETKDKNGKALSEEKIKEQKKAAKEAKKTLELIEKRYATLGIPVIIDRSASEKDEIANAEWIKVYGALFGCQKEANKLFAEYEKKYKEEHNEQ